MIKRQPIILIILAASGLFFLPWQAIAQELTVKLPDDELIIKNPTIEDFKGTDIISRRNLLTYQAPAVENLTRKALGQSAQTQLGDTLTFRYKIDKVYAYVKNLTAKINRPAQEPELEIANWRAKKFTPPKDGVEVDVYKSAFDLLNALSLKNEELNLTVYITKPRMTLENLNNLGIKELVAEGISNFKGSPKNRRHNIKVGIEKFRGVIIAPGEEFSFNKYLGPVEAEQGFLPELVIKRTGTVPEFGGGLCQVSSTTFRAAMKAGLPITQRKNHAYAVVYYAPQGTDATIYPGAVDLKFINNTPGHILIWPYFKSDNDLAFAFYGTRDDRQIVIDPPVQYDRKPDGSMKATWTRTVTLNGESKKDTFKSVYLSPALFHKEETFVTPTTTLITN